MPTIKIAKGKHGGFHLQVNRLSISAFFDRDNTIKAIESNYGVPYGATEWVSIQALRRFWSDYMPMIIASTQKPYISVWGVLYLSEEKQQVA